MNTIVYQIHLNWDLFCYCSSSSSSSWSEVCGFSYSSSSFSFFDLLFNIKIWILKIFEMGMCVCIDLRVKITVFKVFLFLILTSKIVLVFGFWFQVFQMCVLISSYVDFRFVSLISSSISLLSHPLVNWSRIFLMFCFFFFASLVYIKKCGWSLSLWTLICLC